jgi:hypothetical protein
MIMPFDCKMFPGYPEVWNRPGAKEKVPLQLPPGIRVERIPEGKNLSAMLVAGDIDALMTAQVPKPYVERVPEVRRLFANPREVERDHFQRTGIFPIMHVMVIREDCYRRHPWVAQSLYKALLEAKTHCIETLYKNDSLHSALPWAGHYIEETKQLMGHDYWPYGIELNRKTLETFLRYCQEQPLSNRNMEVDELFAHETLQVYQV